MFCCIYSVDDKDAVGAMILHEYSSNSSTMSKGANNNDDMTIVVAML